MKLIAKYNRVNIPITIAILLICSIGYYFILSYALLNGIVKDLEIEQQEIIQFIKEKDALPESSNSKNQKIAFNPTTLSHFETKIYRENIYNKAEDEEEPFRSIDFLVKQNGKNYIATVKKSEQETEDIVQLISIITLSVIAVLLLILFLANRFVLNKLWRPFNDTLEQMKQFNLSSKNKIKLQITDVDEFKELNETASSMIKKISDDYESLKRFTENASHEIQTPLAIIKNKIELLVQMENLDESQINLIQGVHEAASRISRLNQSLLLLAKIENHQFKITEKINFSAILFYLVTNFEELASAKNIDIEKHIAENVFLEMNESLAEILISNLLLNAIKHNYEAGKMTVFLDRNGLRVVNTGSDPQGDPSLLFQRFVKNSSAPDSLGLGLSIVKTICDACHFTLSYLFNEGVHTLRIKFN